ncbi:MAG: pyridoxamine 5'-phosphate oxidase family protein [Halioglobus sp.]|nr:pyridoxamine 5'-phosphate oxidase family protein [Halioglobus sp.]
MAAVYKGQWDAEGCRRFLAESVYPMRLACVADDGFPRVVSLWYSLVGEQLLCVSHRSSQLIALLEGNERVGFEVAPNEPPYRGVRGQGTVRLASDADGEVLTHMLQRYLGRSDSKLGRWLLSRADGEMVIRIEPTRMFSWDYSERMDDLS